MKINQKINQLEKDKSTNIYNKTQKKTSINEKTSPSEKSNGNKKTMKKTTG